MIKFDGLMLAINMIGLKENTLMSKLIFLKPSNNFVLEPINYIIQFNQQIQTIILNQR